MGKLPVHLRASIPELAAVDDDSGRLAQHLDLAGLFGLKANMVVVIEMA